VNDAQTRSSRGLDATGVGALDCARHNMKRACSVGDLQKGERFVASILLIHVISNSVSRYVNMDYLFFSSLKRTDVRQVVISYDIACQWHKHLWSRMQSYPSELHVASDVDFTFMVPKFHLPAHIEKCQTRFSFNLERGMGRTDGEAPERSWANSNRIAASTKEMGPGSRRDTLDDHFGDWNWKKTCTMSESLVYSSMQTTEEAVPETILLRKLKDAVANELLAMQALQDFEDSLSEQSGTLSQWRDDVRAWEQKKEGLNPYESRVSGLSTLSRYHHSTSLTIRSARSLPRVRLGIAQEEAHSPSDGISVHHDVLSPSMWIHAGIELEDEQYV
jgi:hypothetical protein